MWVQLVSNVLPVSHCSSDNCWEACAHLLPTRADVACPWYLQMLSLGREVANSRSVCVSVFSYSSKNLCKAENLGKLVEAGHT